MPLSQMPVGDSGVRRRCIIFMVISYSRVYRNISYRQQQKLAFR